MIKISAPIISDIEDLRKSLQLAIELEHATIPTYLTALFSLREGTNTEIAALLRSVVIEEMLHMTLAANVLNAIGGHPDINKPDFIPKYPGPLPMGIGDEGDEIFIVPLKKFSKEHVFNVFMKIEEPESPISFPRAATALAAEQPRFQTIGEFYTAIMEKIESLGDGIFTGDPSYQVMSWFDDAVSVVDVESGLRAIKLIISQGEGSTKSPVDSEGSMAHYYRFAEIYYGRRLVEDRNSERGYSYTGEPVPFDPAGVISMIDNPHSSNYKPGSQAQRLANQFNYTYSSLLNALHIAFNGLPAHIDEAMGLMYGLKLQAGKMLATPVSEAHFAGPSFEYTRVNV